MSCGDAMVDGCSGRKLESMEAGLREVGEEIATLDTARNALLAQLAQLEAQLAQAHARRADLEESRAVFEEGVAFSLDALQHQVRPPGSLLHCMSLSTRMPVDASLLDIPRAHLSLQSSQFVQHNPQSLSSGVMLCLFNVTAMTRTGTAVLSSGNVQ